VSLNEESTPAEGLHEDFIELSYSMGSFHEESESERTFLSLLGSGLIVGRMQRTAVHPQEKTVDVVELLVPEIEGEFAQQAKRKIIFHELTACTRT
jgi:hypothetical protein